MYHPWKSLKMHIKFLLEHLRGKDCLQNLGIDGRSLLFKKFGRTVWIGFVQTSYRLVAASYKHDNKHLSFTQGGDLF
jgi:hypothetical protein